VGGAQREAVAAEWGQHYPAVGQAWRRAWEQVVPLFAVPPAIRKMIYTTNAVDSLNCSRRTISNTRGRFPRDEAALKLLLLAIRIVGVSCRRPIEGTAAVGKYAILFGERFQPSAPRRLE
jgi:putative transposase